jgi:hypothetical protein
VLRIIRSHAPDGLPLMGELDAARHKPFMAALTSLGQTNTHILCRISSHRGLIWGFAVVGGSAPEGSQDGSAASVLDRLTDIQAPRFRPRRSAQQRRRPRG